MDLFIFLNYRTSFLLIIRAEIMMVRLIIMESKQIGHTTLITVLNLISIKLSMKASTLPEMMNLQMDDLVVDTYHIFLYQKRSLNSKKKKTVFGILACGEFCKAAYGNLLLI